MNKAILAIFVIFSFFSHPAPSVAASKYHSGNAISEQTAVKNPRNKHQHLKSSKNDHRGMASWYGAEFHGKKTASGQTYNMYAMSAAHKTLPLLSYAKVTNLKNHRSVIVRINDRGPFHGKREMDLSYAAAKKLGISGVGVVTITPIYRDSGRSKT